MDLKDEQWALIEPLFPPIQRREDGRGRPPKSQREVLHGILWILRTGALWQDLPTRYPPYQTCHRYFQRWSQSGVFSRILEVLAQHLKERGDIDLVNVLSTGPLSWRKKEALCRKNQAWDGDQNHGHCRPD